MSIEKEGTPHNFDKRLVIYPLLLLTSSVVYSVVGIDFLGFSPAERAISLNQLFDFPLSRVVRDSLAAVLATPPFIGGILGLVNALPPRTKV